MIHVLHDTWYYVHGMLGQVQSGVSLASLARHLNQGVCLTFMFGGYLFNLILKLVPQACTEDRGQRRWGNKREGRIPLKIIGD